MRQGAVGKVTWCFRTGAGGTGLAVIPDEESESGPRVCPKDEGLCLVLTPMTGCWMVVESLEHTEMEVTRVWNIDVVIEPE